MMTARMITISLIVAVAAAAAGCGGTGQSGSATAAAKPPSSSPTASAAPAARSSAGAASPSAAASSQPRSHPATSGIAIYHPSTVVIKRAHYALLHTPDSVAKVSAFYERVLAAAGWRTISRNAVGASTNLIVRKHHAGASISITRAGPPGTSISITTHG